MQHVRRGTNETLRTLSGQEPDLVVSVSPEVLVSLPSSSPIQELYRSPDVRLAWDNEIAFQVAQHAVSLRKYRNKSQAEIAEAMGTSQSAVALIESGEHNITMSKLKRLVAALDGRIQFAIEPKELSVPRWPAWWHLIDAGLQGDWRLRGATERSDGTQRHLLAGWSTFDQTTALIKPEHVIDAEAT